METSGRLRFYASPGEGFRVLSTGACLSKKAHSEAIRLGVGHGLAFLAEIL